MPSHLGAREVDASRRNSLPSLLLRPVRFLLMVSSIAFLVYLLRDPRVTFSVLGNAAVGSIVGAFLLSLAAVAATAVLWVKLIGYLGEGPWPADISHLVRSFARSWLTRYLPGSAWSQASRLVNTDRNVAPLALLTTSVADEFFFTISSAAVLGVSTWIWSRSGVLLGLAAGLGLFGVAVIIASRLHSLTQRSLQFIHRMLSQRHQPPDRLLSNNEGTRMRSRASIAFSGGYLLINLAGGFSFVLVAASISPLELAEVPLLIGAYNLAAVIGVLAIFTPAGLGVREAVLTAMIAPTLTVPTAASAAILLRALTIVSDFLFFAIVELTTSWRQGSRAADRARDTLLRSSRRRLNFRHEPSLRLGTYYRAQLFRHLQLHKVEGRVLDVGGFNGYWSTFLDQRADAFVIDMNPVPAYRRVTYVRGDALDLPFRDGSFDAVFALEVIEHVRDERRLLAEAVRVLRPGGRLIISTPSATVHIWPKRIQPWVNRRWGHERVPGFRPDYLKSLLGDLDVSEVRVTSLGVPALRRSYLFLTAMWRLVRPIGRWLVGLTAAWDSRHKGGDHGYVLTEATRGNVKIVSLDKPSRDPTPFRHRGDEA